MNTHRSSGFTFVELIVVLFVLLIIGVVATLVYNSISARAENTRMISAMSAYEEALGVYYDQNDAYPASFDTEAWRSTGSIDIQADAACLGSDYAETAEFHEGVCAAYVDYDSGTIIPDISNKLETILSTSPSVGTDNIYYYHETWKTRGMRYVSMSGSQRYQLAYTLTGDRDCEMAEKEISIVDEVRYTHCTLEYYQGARTN